MRIDILNGTDYEKAIAVNEISHVTLDGQPLPMCVAADEEEGEAIIYVTDERGRLLKQLGRYGFEDARKIVTGEVRIIWNDGITIDDVRQIEQEIFRHRIAAQNAEMQA